MVAESENSITECPDIARIPGPVRLAKLLEGLEYSTTGPGAADQVMIEAVTTDSRQVGKQCLFVALAGTKTDGHRYLEQAAAKGCAAVVVEKGRGDAAAVARAGVLVVTVADSRQALAAIAANLYGRPAREMTFIGVTGTNGKTTVTYLLEHVLTCYGLKVGVIGTVNYRYSTPAGKVEIPAPFTTPDPLILQRCLRTMAQAGVSHVVMEASSHALDQDRLGDIRFDVAAFTNLSHDHLDYHAGMEDYFAAKTRLFTDYLKHDGRAVITCGEAESGQDWPGRLDALCRESGIVPILVGVVDNNDIRLIHADSRRDGTTIMLETAAGDVRIDSPMVGRFNVDNIVTTMGICQALGLNLSRTAGFLAAAGGAPGRLQRIGTGDDPSRPLVFVDYAHTPDALGKALKTLAALPHRDLFCVFGCGGDRDTAKRPLMGAIAAAASDVVIITDDNPRTESSAGIIEQILPGLRGSLCQEYKLEWLRRRQVTEKGFVVLPARKKAIAAAVVAAGPEDIVLIAGKGHETYQLVGAGRRFFDDALEAGEALIAWNCTSIGKAVGGRFAGNFTPAPFRSVCTDSRSLNQDDIFIALKGESFDGHDFLPQAVEAGAGCLVVSRSADFVRYPDIPRFLVPDTQEALGNLAAFRRRLLGSISNPLVIGLTGSCGKTTVKDMTAAILERRWPDGPNVPSGRVLKTKGNFNNLIGLPLSLLPLGVRHKAAIMEMGMNHPGEIAKLAQIARPTISCIVSVHPAHLEGLHTLQGVAAAKEELFANTPADGILAINLDDELIRTMASRYRQKKITYSATKEGQALHPDLFATEIAMSDSGSVSYTLHHGEELIRVNLNVAGLHNITNSLAAAAMAVAAGCELSTIAAGLADFRPGDKRMVIIDSPAGYRLIDDTYNANPGSMAAGLKTLSQLAPGTTMAILGDMLELGEASAQSHRHIGRLATEQGVSLLALYGQFAADTKAGAVSAGMEPDRARVFTDKNLIADWVRDLGVHGLLKRGDWILIKASRGMRFETIVAQLMGDS